MLGLSHGPGQMEKFSAVVLRRAWGPRVSRECGSSPACANRGATTGCPSFGGATRNGTFGYFIGSLDEVALYDKALAAIASRRITLWGSRQVSRSTRSGDSGSVLLPCHWRARATDMTRRSAAVQRFVAITS